jgi:LPXTG-motif cell wall-anchored protein
MHLLLAQTSNEGDGVNLLPIILVVVLVAVGLYLWRRRR